MKFKLLIFLFLFFLFIFIFKPSPALGVGCNLWIGKNAPGHCANNCLASLGGEAQGDYTKVGGNEIDWFWRVCDETGEYSCEVSGACQTFNGKNCYGKSVIATESAPGTNEGPEPPGGWAGWNKAPCQVNIKDEAGGTCSNPFGENWDYWGSWDESESGCAYCSHLYEKTQKDVYFCGDLSVGRCIEHSFSYICESACGADPQCDEQIYEAEVDVAGGICNYCVFEKPNCGNGALDAGEDCDIGLDKIPGNADDIDKACEGQCQANCTCLGGPGGNCGNGALDAGEDCDIGLDKIPGNADDIDKACEGQCQANCTCLVGNCPPQCPCPDGICPAELKGGLVPCGRRCEDPDTAICECCPCTLCHFFVLAKGVIDFVTLNIVTPLGVLMLVIGGGLFLTAAGDPGRINQGKGIIKAVIIGLIIIFVSWLIVDTIISFLTTGSPFATVFQSWNNINCPVP